MQREAALVAKCERLEEALFQNSTESCEFLANGQLRRSLTESTRSLASKITDMYARILRSFVACPFLTQFPGARGAGRGLEGMRLLTGPSEGPRALA